MFGRNSFTSSSSSAPANNKNNNANNSSASSSVHPLRAYAQDLMNPLYNIINNRNSDNSSNYPPTSSLPPNVIQPLKDKVEVYMKIIDRTISPYDADKVQTGIRKYFEGAKSKLATTATTVVVSHRERNNNNNNNSKRHHHQQHNEKDRRRQRGGEDDENCQVEATKSSKKSGNDNNSAVHDGNNNGNNGNNNNNDDDGDDIDDLIVDSEEIPLICNLSKRPIQIPARLRQCGHLRCTDLLSWIESCMKIRSSRIQSLRFSCPTCRGSGTVNDVEVDLFQLQQIHSLLLEAAAATTMTAEPSCSSSLSSSSSSGTRITSMMNPCATATTAASSSRNYYDFASLFTRLDSKNFPIKLKLHANGSVEQIREVSFRGENGESSSAFINVDLSQLSEVVAFNGIKIKQERLSQAFDFTRCDEQEQDQSALQQQEEEQQHHEDDCTQVEEEDDDHLQRHQQQQQQDQEQDREKSIASEQTVDEGDLVNIRDVSEKDFDLSEFDIAAAPAPAAAPLNIQNNNDGENGDDEVYCWTPFSHHIKGRPFCNKCKMFVLKKSKQQQHEPFPTSTEINLQTSAKLPVPQTTNNNNNNINYNNINNSSNNYNSNYPLVELRNEDILFCPKCKTESRAAQWNFLWPLEKDIRRNFVVVNHLPAQSVTVVTFPSVRMSNSLYALLTNWFGFEYFCTSSDPNHDTLSAENETDPEIRQFRLARQTNFKSMFVRETPFGSRSELDYLEACFRAEMIRPNSWWSDVKPRPKMMMDRERLVEAQNQQRMQQQQRSPSQQQSLSQQHQHQQQQRHPERTEDDGVKVELTQSGAFTKPYYSYQSSRKGFQK